MAETAAEPSEVGTRFTHALSKMERVREVGVRGVEPVHGGSLTGVRERVEHRRGGGDGAERLVALGLEVHRHGDERRRVTRVAQTIPPFGAVEREVARGHRQEAPPVVLRDARARGDQHREGRERSRHHRAFRARASYPRATMVARDFSSSAR